jgi:hypothetical protein
MISAYSLLDRVVPFCPGWSRSTGTKSLLQLAQEAIDELYNFSAEQIKYYGLSKELPSNIQTARLTSESIKITIAPKWEKAIVKYIIGRVQELESGRSNDNIVEFHQLWKPSFQSEFLNSYGTTENETDIRYC